MVFLMICMAKELFHFIQTMLTGEELTQIISEFTGTNSKQFVVDFSSLETNTSVNHFLKIQLVNGSFDNKAAITDKKRFAVLLGATEDQIKHISFTNCKLFRENEIIFILSSMTPLAAEQSMSSTQEATWKQHFLHQAEKPRFPSETPNSFSSIFPFAHTSETIAAVCGMTD